MKNPQKFTELSNKNMIVNEIQSTAHTIDIRFG